MKSLALWKVRLAFGLVMLALLTMGTISYRSMVISDNNNKSVRHVRETLTNTQELALAIESIESASRGFVLTGEESYLESYRANVARVAQDQATLRAQTADNSVQQLYSPNLGLLAAERIRYAD